eukprot:m.180050 g.180050  ORF g.180050 m.180050 type:complete len:57 (+) comp39237_c0_seq28:1262-1432(+)
MAYISHVDAVPFGHQLRIITSLASLGVSSCLFLTGPPTVGFLCSNGPTCSVHQPVL